MTASLNPVESNLIIKTRVIWSEKECLTYFLLYAANTDFFLQASERNFIFLKVGEEVYQKILPAFEADDDQQRAQKVLRGLKLLEYTLSDLDQLLAAIKLLFICDQEYAMLEKNMIELLKKLFKEPNH